MAISRFPFAFDEMAKAIDGLRSSLIAIRDQTGDLTFQHLSHANHQQRHARIAVISMMSEVAKAPVAAMKYVTDMNGPTTIADLQKEVVATDAAGKAWNDFQETSLAKLTNMVAMVSRPSAVGGTERHLEFASFIPAEQAKEFRESPELQAFIVALDIGA